MSQLGSDIRAARKPQASPLLTTKEAARTLNLSHRTLEDWRLRGGGPPFIRLGAKAVRYALADLVVFAEAGFSRTTANRLAA